MVNRLTSLDISKNSNLKWLDCSSNQLTSLDVSNNSELDNLYCGSNQLTSLDVSNNPELFNFCCDRNQLSTLDISNNLNLRALFCEENQLTTLDLSHNSKLGTLNANDNLLTTLDLSHNPKLSYLYIYNNQLTSLDLAHNPKLVFLECGGQSYNIKVYKETLKFDLNSLPRDFVPDRVNFWQGAKLDGSSIKIDPTMPDHIWYGYNTKWPSKPVPYKTYFYGSLKITYIETPPQPTQPKDILIPCPYGAVICPTQPAQTIPLTPVPTPIPVQQKSADDVQAQVAQLPKTGEQDTKALAIRSLLLLSLGAFFIISKKK